MRNVHLVLAFLAVFSTHQLTAQPSQIGFSNHLVSKYPGTNGDQHFISSARTYSEGLPEIGAFRLQSNGQQSYVKLFWEGEPLFLDVLPLDDGYLAAASFFQCDILLDWKLYRFNWNGDTIWVKEPGLGVNLSDTLKLLPGPGGTFWMFRYGALPAQFSADGDFIGNGPFVLPTFLGFQRTADQRLLTYGKSGLALYTPDLQSLQFGLQNTPLLGAVELPGNRFAAQSSDSLYVLDAGLNVLKKAELGTDLQLQLTYSQGLLHLLTDTNPKQMLQFDTSTLALQQTLTVPQQAPFQPHLMATNGNDEFVLAGHELNWSTMPSQVVEFRTVPVGSAPDYGATADATLDEVYMPNLPVGIDLGSPVPGYFISVDGVAVRVTNLGSSTLEKVTVNGVLNAFSWHCGEEQNYYLETFTNLNLAPGANIQLELGVLDWGRPFAVLPTQVTLCFWTTLPNDSLDADYTNNRSCMTMPVIVSTDTPEPAVSPIVIRPNPAYDTTMFEWENADFAPAQIRVFDAAGVLIIEQNVQGNQWRFQCGKQAAGLYTVLIRNENGQLFAGKLVLR